MQPMINLSDDTIENYLNNNIEVLKRVVKENKVGVLHANHAVLMSVVARRVSEELSVPFAIMPHGSAIEYAVKKIHGFLTMHLRPLKKQIVFMLSEKNCGNV